MKLIQLLKKKLYYLTIKFLENYTLPPPDMVTIDFVNKNNNYKYIKIEP